MKTHPPKHPQAARGQGLRLGVDIGRVLVSGEGTDTSFFSHSAELALRTPEVPGALAAVARLAEALDRRVWLVSKCGPKIQARTLAWLEHVRFYELTGLPRENVHFCRERPDKAPICRRLGIEAFVDDREDVLRSMAGIVPFRLLFGSRSSSLAGVTPVASWAEAEPIILGLDRRDRGGTVAEPAR